MYPVWPHLGKGMKRATSSTPKQVHLWGPDLRFMFKYKPRGMHIWAVLVKVWSWPSPNVPVSPSRGYDRWLELCAITSLETNSSSAWHQVSTLSFSQRKTLWGNSNPLESIVSIVCQLKGGACVSL